MRIYSFWEHHAPLHRLIFACTFIILEETILPARLLKPKPFWILQLVMSEKCRNSCQNVIAPQVQQPRTNFDEKIHIKLTFSAYLLGTHLPCTIIWDTFTLHLYLKCNSTLLLEPARLLILEDFSSPPFYLGLQLN